MNLEHKKEGREAELVILVWELKTIGKINEAMRMDEVAKEISGENGRLEDGKGKGEWLTDKSSVPLITCF